MILKRRPNFWLAMDLSSWMGVSGLSTGSTKLMVRWMTASHAAVARVFPFESVASP